MSSRQTRDGSTSRAQSITSTIAPSTPTRSSQTPTGKSQEQGVNDVSAHSKRSQPLAAEEELIQSKPFQSPCEFPFSSLFYPFIFFSTPY